MGSFSATTGGFLMARDDGFFGGDLGIWGWFSREEPYKKHVENGKDLIFW